MTHPLCLNDGVMQAHLTEIFVILDRSGACYTWKQLAASIRHQTEKYQWQFLFLAANQDAIATAGRMSIAVGDTSNFVATEESYAAAKSALSRKMSAVRRRSQGAMDEITVRDAKAPLESLREDEENKGRQ